LSTAKVSEAVEREKKRRKQEKQLSIDDERQRNYNSFAGQTQSGEISPEELEAYRLERMRSDDPMAKFV